MAVMAAIGGAMMKAGSAVAGPAMTKKMSGRGLSTGSMFTKKMAKDIAALNISSKASLKIMKGMAKGLVKFTQFMAKSSPALQQQLIVLGKSITLILKPIGDIMAKFLRPMSLWVMKVAMKWYSMFATKSKGIEDPESALNLEQAKLDAEKAKPESEQDQGLINELEDNIAELKKQIEESVAPISDWVKGIQDFNTKMSDGLEPLTDFQTAADEAFDESRWAKMTDGLSKGVSDMWTEMLPESIRGLFESISGAASAFWEVLKDLWEVLEPIVKPLFDIVAILTGAVLTTALDILTGFFEGLVIVFTDLSAILKLMSSGWDIAVVIFEKFQDWLADKLPTVIESLFGWFDKLWTKIKDFASWIKDKMNIFSIGKTKSAAVGGDIDRTGLYQLHAGERVITAGETSRSNNSNSTNITNNITVQATINNGMDIQDLARQLAELNETELRRRVSYL